MKLHNWKLINTYTSHSMTRCGVLFECSNCKSTVKVKRPKNNMETIPTTKELEIASVERDCDVVQIQIVIECLNV